MMTTIPAVFSLRVQNAARTRIAMVTGMTAIVSPNSTSRVCKTMTTNCTVNPRKKKKSNFRRAMYIYLVVSKQLFFL